MGGGGVGGEVLHVCDGNQDTFPECGVGCGGGGGVGGEVLHASADSAYESLLYTHHGKGDIMPDCELTVQP